MLSLLSTGKAAEKATNDCTKNLASKEVFPKLDRWGRREQKFETHANTLIWFRGGLGSGDAGRVFTAGAESATA
jgi:hypothetical protein